MCILFKSGCKDSKKKEIKNRWTDISPTFLKDLRFLSLFCYVEIANERVPKTLFNPHIALSINNLCLIAQAHLFVSDRIAQGKKHFSCLFFL